MFLNVKLPHDGGALQAEVVGSQGSGDDGVGHMFANLRDDRDIVEDLAQNGLVVLNAVGGGLLVSVKKQLKMLCMTRV